MKKIFITTLFLFLICSLTNVVYATEYYVDPVAGNNGDDGLSEANAWATFAYAMDQLSAGDTLWLMDGTYNTASLLIDISGTNGNPISFKALNDGQAIIDGGASFVPIDIQGNGGGRFTDITVEGIYAKNSSNKVIRIHYADRIIFRRVSGDTSASGNFHVWSIWNATEVLLEDVAGYGGRFVYDILSSNNITLRRPYARYEDQSDEPRGIIQFYGSDDCLAENLVGTQDSGSSHPIVVGLKIWAAGQNSCDRNEYLGCVIHNMLGAGGQIISREHNITGNRLNNNVIITCDSGVYQGADSDLIVNQLTVKGKRTGEGTSWMFAVDEFNRDPKDADYELIGTLSNSILFDDNKGMPVSDAPATQTSHFVSFENKYNCLYSIDGTWPNENYYINIASQGTGDINVDPEFGTPTYGNGAFLIRPSVLNGLGENGSDIGAEVLYRYEDGVLTSVPLWPWPMEARVMAEAGVSVTYSDDQGGGESEGIWKTLDGVYENRSSPATMSGEWSQLVIDFLLKIGFFGQADKNAEYISQN